MQLFRDLASYTFLQYALLAGLLASVASGLVGSLIVVRRTTYIAGAISHCVLGGMGLARYLQQVHGWAWMTPLTGAVLSALAATLVIGWVDLKSRERIDSILSIIWALGMAVGITFITLTPGYGHDLMSYLFGNILMVTGQDLVLMVLLDLVILTVIGLGYNRFLAISFNQEAARMRGIPVGTYTVLFLVITALTTVLLVQVVGIVLVIALLTLPAAIASRFTQRLSSTMLAAFLLCLALTLGGLMISYPLELPVGATIIELAAVTYLGVIAVKYWMRKTAR